MTILEVKSPKGIEQINIYSDADIENGNIGLSGFIDFKSWDHQYHQKLREGKDGYGEDGLYERSMAVQLLCGGSDDFWSEEPYSDGLIEDKDEYFIDQNESKITLEKLYYHHFNLFNGWMARHLIKIKEIVLEKHANDEDYKNLIAIIENKKSSLVECMQAILIFSELTGEMTYTKDTLEFKHGDRSFTVGIHTIEKYYGEKGFTFSDTILLKELRKSMKARIKALTDPEGLFDMELSLYEMAILCKGKADKLPINPKQRDLFMKKRARLFQDIPMITFYRVCFFLITSLVRLGINQTINHFGKIYMKTLEAQSQETPQQI